MSEEEAKRWGPFRIVEHNIPNTDGLLVLVADKNFKLGEIIFNEDGTFEVKLNPGMENSIVVVRFNE